MLFICINIVLAMESSLPTKDTEYPTLPLYEESWSILTMKTHLEQFFVRTWGVLLFLTFSSRHLLFY